MKPGKLSQTVWNRSVQRQLNSDWEADFLLKPSKAEACTAMSGFPEGIPLTASASVFGQAPSLGTYAAAKAVNDIAARGGVPMGISVSITLPENAEEALLQEMIRQMDRLCRKFHIPIAGMQAEVSPAVRQVLIQVTALGQAEEAKLLRLVDTMPRQDIVLCGYIGLEGMLRILDECLEELGRRFSPAFLRQMRELDSELFRFEAIRMASGSVTAMQQIGSGGILGTLWELAEAAGVGLNVDLKKMSIRQETVELCEYYHLNPYQMTSAGSVLMITEHGERLAQALSEGGARASVLGVTTAGNARVVTSGEESRFLDRPAPDELMWWWAERLS